MDPENQNFEKMEKTPEDIIILQTCNINDSHMMYGSGFSLLGGWGVIPPSLAENLLIPPPPTK